MALHTPIWSFVGLRSFNGQHHSMCHARHEKEEEPATVADVAEAINWPTLQEVSAPSHLLLPNHGHPPNPAIPCSIALS